MIDNLLGFRRLGCAVIERAYMDLIFDPTVLKFPNKRREAEKQKSQAIRWFKSNSENICRLLWWCKLLDINPLYIKRKVKRYLEDDTTQIRQTQETESVKRKRK